MNLYKVDVRPDTPSEIAQKQRRDEEDKKSDVEADKNVDAAFQQAKRGWMKDTAVLWERATT